MLGNKVEDNCYKSGSVIRDPATLTRDQCLTTCESRMIHGCEFNNVSPNPECIFHTKYIVGTKPNVPGALVHVNKDFTCWPFKRGM